VQLKRPMCCDGNHSSLKIYQCNHNGDVYFSPTVYVPVCRLLPALRIPPHNRVLEMPQCRLCEMDVYASTSRRHGHSISLSQRELSTVSDFYPAVANRSCSCHRTRRRMRRGVTTWHSTAAESAESWPLNSSVPRRPRRTPAHLLRTRTGYDGSPSGRRR
jgi:hypothetical protein